MLRQDPAIASFRRCAPREPRTRAARGGPIQAELGRRVRTQSRAVEIDDLAAQRHADDLAAAQRGAGERDADGRRRSGSQHVRHSGALAS
jgi:hypothetical protein